MRLIVYLSRLAHPFTPDELLALGISAAEKNLRMGITGVLLNDNRRFMQAIEGPTSAVQSLMSTIARDPRHREVSYVFEGPIQARQFGDWSMRTTRLDPNMTVEEMRATVADLLVATTELPVKAAFFGFAATSRKAISARRFSGGR